MKLEAKIHRIYHILIHIRKLFISKCKLLFIQIKQRLNFQDEYIILIIDSFIAALSLFISIHLQVGLSFEEYSLSFILTNIFVFSLVASSTFLWFNTAFWTNYSIKKIIRTILSVIISNILFFPLMMLMNRDGILSYQILIINVFVFLCLFIIPRLIINFIKNKALENNKIILIGKSSYVNKTLIYFSKANLSFTPLGFITLDYEEVNNKINLPMLGNINNFKQILKIISTKNNNISNIVIIDPNISLDYKNMLINYVKRNNIALVQMLIE